jgi:nucleoside-diphosphate-sugar epimerase
MSRRVALTGATGFIGSVLAKQLQAAGWQVKALVRPSSDTTALAELEVEQCLGTLEDRQGLRRLVQDVHAVIHCAGAVRGITPTQFDQVNVDGVANLVQVTAEQAVPPRFLLVSSLAAREPELSPYAASKWRGEQVLVTSAAGKMRWMILRPPAVYGPGDRELLPLFKWMKQGIALILGPSQARFSLLYVEDLAAAILKWLDREAASAGIFELHDGHPGGYSWDEVVDIAATLRGKRIFCIPVSERMLQRLGSLSVMVAKAGGYTPMLTPGKVRELRHPNWVGDNTALNHAIDWVPRVSLAEGLHRTLGLC